jgi:hypothetical protein
VVEDGNGFGMQAFLQIGPATLLSLDQSCGDLGDRRQLLLRGQSVVALRRNSACRQLFEGGDAYHVEFVEVAV